MNYSAAQKIEFAGKNPAAGIAMKFCCSERTAQAAVDRVLADSMTGIVAIDIETCPVESEARRLRELLLEEARLEGVSRARKRLGQ